MSSFSSSGSGFGSGWDEGALRAARGDSSTVKRGLAIAFAGERGGNRERRRPGVWPPKKSGSVRADLRL